MTIQLSASDFRQLTAILQNLPDFTNVRDRRRLLLGALEGVPNANLILARLDLEGTPMGASVEVIKFLSSFGQVAYGKESLGVFINYIIPFVGEEDQDFLINLFVHYNLDSPVSQERPLRNWKGTEDANSILEKIIGENTLRPIYILELALTAAKSVLHLEVTNNQGSKAYGTGFMIASDLLMTNHHVIGTQTEAIQTAYTFNYQLDRSQKVCLTQPAQALNNGLFYTNSDLDYTIIQLQQLPDFEAFLQLQKIQIRKNDRVSIIQHPGGHLKQISMQNNFVEYADERVVQYTTSTLPGSSGSPVFNDDFKVIAIHHSGGMLVEPNSQRRYLRNEGISMIAILKDLEANAKEIYTKLSL